jgi:hypothetical protein
MTAHHVRHVTRDVLWFVTALMAVAVLAVADDLIRHGLLVLVAVALGAAGFLIGRRTGRGGSGRAATRGLEAAQRDRLAAELESLSGRSLDEITESYRVTARRHGAR